MVIKREIWRSPKHRCSEELNGKIVRVKDEGDELFGMTGQIFASRPSDLDGKDYLVYFPVTSKRGYIQSYHQSKIIIEEE